MMMIPFAIFGAIFTALASKAFPGICRISFEPLKSFLKLMLWVTAIRALALTITGTPDYVDTGVISRITPWMTLGVFWEDAAFTLPILIFERLGINKILKNILIVLSSVVFAYGHLAYGPLWAAITLMYVPLLSYRIGKKHGLGTVMAGHVIYDFVTILTLKIFG